MKSINLFLIVLCVGLYSCKNPEELVVETVESIPSATVVNDFNAFNHSAPTGITAVAIKGNKMSLTVQYNGGCQKHNFQLLGHRMISKSLPPQRSIRLFHDAKGDDCRELVQEVLVFEISALGYNNEPTTLILEGYEPQILFTPAK
jgi:hypothetical protein